MNITSEVTSPRTESLTDRGLSAKALPGYSVVGDELVPGFFPLRSFCGWAGISVSYAYLEAAAGRLTIRKNGRSSGVTGPEAIRYRDALPVAEFRAAA